MSFKLHSKHHQGASSLVEMHRTISSNLAHVIRPYGSSHPVQTDAERRLLVGSNLCHLLVKLHARYTGSSAVANPFTHLGGIVAAAEVTLGWRGPSRDGSVFDPAECMASSMVETWWRAHVSIHPGASKQSDEVNESHECSELLLAALLHPGARHVDLLRSFLERWYQAVERHLQQHVDELLEGPKGEAGSACAMPPSTCIEGIAGLMVPFRRSTGPHSGGSSSGGGFFTKQCWHATWASVWRSVSNRLSTSIVEALPSSRMVIEDMLMAYVQSQCASATLGSVSPVEGGSPITPQELCLKALRELILLRPKSCFPRLVVDILELCSSSHASSPATAAVVTLKRGLLAIAHDLQQDPVFLRRLVDTPQPNAAAPFPSEESLRAAQCYAVHLVLVDVVCNRRRRIAPAVVSDLLSELIGGALHVEGQPAHLSHPCSTAVDLEMFALQLMGYAQHRLVAAPCGGDISAEVLTEFLAGEITLLGAARNAFGVLAAAVKGGGGCGGLSQPRNILSRWYQLLMQWASSWEVQLNSSTGWPQDDAGASLQVVSLQSDLSLFPQSPQPCDTATGNDASKRWSIVSELLQGGVGEGGSCAGRHDAFHQQFRSASNALRDHFTAPKHSGAPKRHLSWCPTATTATVLLDGWLTCIVAISQMPLLEFLLADSRCVAVGDLENSEQRTSIGKDFQKAERLNGDEGGSSAAVDCILRSLAPVLEALLSPRRYGEKHQSHTLIVSMLPAIVSLCDVPSKQRNAKQSRPAQGGGARTSTTQNLRAEAFIMRNAKRCGSDGTCVASLVGEYINFVQRQSVLPESFSGEMSVEALKLRIAGDQLLSAVRAGGVDVQSCAIKELSSAQESLLSKGYLSAAGTEGVQSGGNTLHCRVVFVPS